MDNKTISQSLLSQNRTFDSDKGDKKGQRKGEKRIKKIRNKTKEKRYY